MRFPRWHRHRDPDWQLVGVHCYEQCRCGARRTSRAYANLAGPVAPDWPDLCDRHGIYRYDSGWQHGAWSTSGYPQSDVRVNEDPSAPEDFDG